MAQITDGYVRERFMRQFAKMPAARREGTIEALVVIHEGKLADENKPPISESDSPLLNAPVAEAG
jgi:hypothetical protein